MNIHLNGVVLVYDLNCKWIQIFCLHEYADFFHLFHPKEYTLGFMSDSLLSYISSCGRKDHVVVGSLCIKWKPNVKWHSKVPCRKAGLGWESLEITFLKIDYLYIFSIWVQSKEWILRSAQEEDLTMAPYRCLSLTVTGCALCLKVIL